MTRTVLTVDDSRTMRDMLRMALAGVKQREVDTRRALDDAGVTSVASSDAALSNRGMAVVAAVSPPSAPPLPR